MFFYRKEQNQDVYKRQIPVCIHLDHAFDLSLIERAVKSGYTSVMLDVSNLPLEENIAQTKRAVGPVSYTHLFCPGGTGAG